jgi:serine/threonine-protein kinase
MDFGLAAIASKLEGAEVRSGTPAYMAPEQPAGRDVTKQSDLYALGLVLYELFTGKAPFAAKDVPELQRQRESHPKTTPSTLIPELDQRLERTILRSLEPDPAQRPRSAIDVAAALPGGDPLAEALAAGETPSPQMVASAGPEGSISPATAIACLIAIAVALAAVVWMSQRTTLASYVAVDRSAEVLVDRARTIAAQLGYQETPAADASGYEVNVEYLRTIGNTDMSPQRWEVLRDARRSPLGFWYRQSPQPLWPTGQTVTRTDPPDSTPGMVTIVTDPGGRLVRLTAVPPAGGGEGVAPAADWTALFGLAEAPFESFTQTAPVRTPPVFATERAAWTGALPDNPSERIRIEAAAHQGVPVYFEIVAPWILSEPVSPLEPEARSALQLVVLFPVIGIIGAIVFLFWRNLRLGRADHRGAVRIGAVVGGSVFIELALVTQNPIDFVPWVGRALAGYTSLAAALLAWANYVALEPYARRVWPETLIGWSRLVAGRVRDPLVGREILIGTVGGVIMALLPHLRALVPAWSGLAPPIPIGGFEGNLEGIAAMFPLLGGRHSLFLLFAPLPNAMSVGLLTAAALFVLVILLRSRRRAIVASLLLLTIGRAATFFSDHQAADFVWAGLIFIIGVILLTRFGLLAMVTHLLVFWWLAAFPFDLDTAAPQAFASYLLLAAVAAVALYGFRTALGRRSIFESSLLGEDT